MKKFLLSVFAFSAVVSVNAQCSDVFISQYVEGSGNNKALEIYNPTNGPINLNNNYRLVRYNNGSSAAAGEANVLAMVNLGAHVIAPHDAWVIVIDMTDPAGTGQNVQADPALQAVADTFLCSDYNVSYAMFFNGNDALSIQKFNGSTWDYVDIFGKMGDAAMTTATGWSDQFPYDGSAGAIWTKDHSLTRKQTVMQGVTTNPSTFIVTTEWDSLPKDDFSGLGIHTCDCPLGINEIQNTVRVDVFPNPSNQDYVNLVAEEQIKSIEMSNLMGQIVFAHQGTVANNKMTIDLTAIEPGIYLTRIYFADNRSTLVKIIVQ